MIISGTLTAKSSPEIFWGSALQLNLFFCILGGEVALHYYDYHRILSYNCPVNLLFGERGCGKSYGAKKYVIEQYLKKQSQFLYLRRYDNELKEIFELTKGQKEFFDDIKDDFKDHHLKAISRKFMLDGEVFGFA